jgi:hypothetical protein
VKLEDIFTGRQYAYCSDATLAGWIKVKSGTLTTCVRRGSADLHIIHGDDVLMATIEVKVEAVVPNGTIELQAHGKATDTDVVRLKNTVTKAIADMQDKLEAQVGAVRGGK